jgi:outer membrane protein OmpA-like peptidoglycan-associated protein
MKPKILIFLAVAVSTPLYAQPPVVVEETVTETTVAPGKKVVVEEVTTAPAVLDPALTRRQLRMAPRALPIPEGVPVTPAPGTVETTETTTTTKRGGRVYNTERSVVVVEGRELPYVTIPVLFVKETAELLDSESRAALQETAAAILEISQADPSARFDIEGHTSTDGADQMNLDLSAARARRVYDELTKRYAVPASLLSAHGYGEAYPNYPNGTEGQMTLDRRVLVVRIK